MKKKLFNIGMTDEFKADVAKGAELRSMSLTGYIIFAIHCRLADDGIISLTKKEK